MPHENPGLRKELDSAIEGEVRFSAGDRALYATDASNYRQVPIGLVVPRTIEDVVEATRICRAHGVPILARGGGTSLAGQTCNEAVVIDMSKYLRKVIEIDPESRTALVEPGVVLDDLRRQAESRHSLTFGPDPATHEYCTLGGMIGNNACGIHAQMAGRVQFNVEALEVLTYTGGRFWVGCGEERDLDRIIEEGGEKGRIYAALRSLRDRHADEIRRRFPTIPRKVSGYNLEELLPESGFNVARALVGTEGTCALILRAKVRLVPHLPERALVVLGFKDVYDAGDTVSRILEFNPIGLEGVDEHLVANMRKKGLRASDLELLPEGNGWLLVEFGADTRREAHELASRMMNALKRTGTVCSMRLYDERDEEHRVWKIRESGLGATARVPGEADTWPGWEDAAVPPERIGDYLRDFRELLNRHGYRCSLYGHFGQGCIHTRIDFDLVTPDGVKKFRRFVGEAADLVSSYGGSYSGEHGDGQARAELLPKMYGTEICDAFREFKRAWDPQWKMNPGKVVDPFPITANLRFGEDYQPLRVETHFKYPEDDGSFARATTRCVGVGKCRRTEGGTMCPSYMIMKEEAHTTRGRARILFEMLQGDELTRKWKEEKVHEALDFCLSCKGCKSDCPVNVDMATYKAEFFSHYYKGRPRPMSAYSMGLIYWWARVASFAPGLVNRIMETPVVSYLLKRIAGVTPRRPVPKFAPATFRRMFEKRGPRNSGRPKVILWPDTFNNHFHPGTLVAATEVLESAGFQVLIPPGQLCCGRPLYDFGMLDTAKALIRRNLEVLQPAIRAGVPVVGLEPSCVAVFRDEMLNLFPHDFDAKRLHEKTFLFSEFLREYAPDFAPPRVERRAIVHGHCHQKSVLGGMDADVELMRKLGLDPEVLDSGCCGMAGSFGFEEHKYEVSVAAGERVLLPAVREASDDKVIIADGFSCREQVYQLAGVRPLHLAEWTWEVLRRAERPGLPVRSPLEPGHQERARPVAARRSGT